MDHPNEKARKMAEEALSRLSTELEAGRSEALKSYLAAMGRFRRYSWGNVLLINSQRPTATHVAGFHRWHQLGRSVKTGEKGIMIFAPMIIKQQDPSQLRDGHRSNEPFRLAGFRTAYVFDVEQTEGRPLPEFAGTGGDPKGYGDKLKALVAKRGISVEYDRTIAPAQGVSAGGSIRLMPGLSPAEEFSVLTHEFTHEMLHHNANAARLPKVVQETQAEAVAYVVCRAVGLETNTAAADYIALYNGDKRTLAESLSVIQETSARILDELLPEDQLTPSPQRSSDLTADRLPLRPGPEAIVREPQEPPIPGPEESISWDR